MNFKLAVDAINSNELLGLLDFCFILCFTIALFLLLSFWVVYLCNLAIKYLYGYRSIRGRPQIIIPENNFERNTTPNIKTYKRASWNTSLTSVDDESKALVISI